MRSIRPKAIGPDRDIEFAAGLREQIAIKRIIAVIEEHPLAPVAALRDVMRRTGNDEAGKPRHEGWIAWNNKKGNRRLSP